MKKALKIDVTKVFVVVLMLCMMEFGWWMFHSWQQDKLEGYYTKMSVVDLMIEKNSIEMIYKKTLVLLNESKQELEDKNEEIQDLLKKLAKNREKRTILGDRLTQEIKKNYDIEEKLQTSQIQLDNLRSEFSRLKQKNEKLSVVASVLEPQVKDSKEDVELEKIVVSKQKETNKPLEGNVLVVNKDYNFVVLDVGISDGINAEDNFIVYQEDTPVGNIIVEEVRPNMSVASFISSDLKELVKEGDRAIRQ